MAPWARYALLFGGIGLAMTLTIILKSASETSCSFDAGTYLVAFASQVFLAAAAGFATNLHRNPSSGRAAMAGFGTGALSSLFGLVLLGLLFAHGLPASCYEQFLGLVLLFYIFLVVISAPVLVGSGALAGWVGGQCATLLLSALREPKH